MSNDKTTPNSPSDTYRKFDITKDSENYTVEICEISSSKERLLAYHNAVRRGENNDKMH